MIKAIVPILKYLLENSPCLYTGSFKLRQLKAKTASWTIKHKKAMDWATGKPNFSPSKKAMKIKIHSITADTIKKEVIKGVKNVSKLGKQF